MNGRWEEEQRPLHRAHLQFTYDWRRKRGPEAGRDPQPPTKSRAQMPAGPTSRGISVTQISPLFASLLPAPLPSSSLRSHGSPAGGQVEGGDAEGGCWPLVGGGAHRRRWRSSSSSSSSSKRAELAGVGVTRRFPARAETAEARRSGRTPGCTWASEQGPVRSAAGLSSRGAFHKRCSLSVPVRQSPTHGAADNKD